MKFSCQQKEFSSAVANVQRAVSSKTTIPALEGILITAKENTITLCGYDTEIGIITTINGSIIEEGSVVINAKLLGDIVRRLPENIVNVSTDEKLAVRILSGKADYQIIGIAEDEYPEMPDINVVDNISLKSGMLKNMIKQTLFAVSTDDARPVYTGSLFDINNNVLKIVSIDGYRMAIRKENIEFSGKNSFIVPGKTLAEILKLITDEDKDTGIDVGQRHAMIKIDNYKIITRLVEGNFIDYKTTVPPDCKTKVKINTRNFISAVERMSLLTSDRVKTPLKLVIEDNLVNMFCSSAIGKANDCVEADVSGDFVEIGLDNRYLLDALRNTETDEVIVEFNGSLTPVKITPIQGDSFLFLVVPMRFK